MTTGPEILVYTKTVCAYCGAAKTLLRGKGVAFRGINVGDDPAELARMVKKSGRRTVPQIFIGEHHVGGYEDLAALDSHGKLDPLLAEFRG